jgi:hypothetical protein
VLPFHLQRHGARCRPLLSAPEQRLGLIIAALGQVKHGQVVQVQNIIPFIGREFKSGDIVRVKITWSTESSENILDVAELPAA